MVYGKVQRLVTRAVQGGRAGPSICFTCNRFPKRLESTGLEYMCSCEFIQPFLHEG